MVEYLRSHDVSVQYVFWQREHQQVRAFLVHTNEGMSDWFDRQWAAANDRADEIFDPERHDAGLAAELFEQATDVWPEDFFLQLSSAVVKDAVTLYELFLELLADEVLSNYGVRLATTQAEKTWRWDDCVAFYDAYLGVDVATARIQAARWIRHKMTHQRSEIRTPAGRMEFEQHLAAMHLDDVKTDGTYIALADHKPYFTHGVELTQGQTLRILDIIADEVASVALAAFPFTHGNSSSIPLLALREGASIRIKGFPNKLLRFSDGGPVPPSS